MTTFNGAWIERTERRLNSPQSTLTMSCLASILKAHLATVFRFFPSRLYFFRYFSTKMPIAVVRSIKEEDVLTISFTYEGKNRKMQRSKDEIVCKALTRIEVSLKKTKKAKRDNSCDDSGNSEDGRASLWFKGELVNSNVTNDLAWRDEAILKIGDQTFSVQVNPPTVLSLGLPDNIMTGFPVLPSLNLEFADKQHCKYGWYKSTNHSEEQASSVPATVSEVLNWEKVGDESLYTPSILDVGCFLKLVCTPGNASKLNEATSVVTSSVTVAAGPGNCPFDARHMYTKKPTAGQHTFRVVSYNILADTYLKDDFAQTVLFPYCPPYALDLSYRQQLLLKEITGYNADIICLQECGSKLFKYNLCPALETMGFECLLKCKGGEVPEGEATFVQKDKFTLLSQHDITLNEALLMNSANEALLDHLSALPILLQTLQKRNAIAQLSILKVTGFENKYLCVANTHLYFKPNYPHIRLLQVYIILNHAREVISKFCPGATGTSFHSPGNINAEMDNASCEKANDTVHCQPQVAFLFCGDFNSIPRSGVVELLISGHIDVTHCDWIFCEDKEEHCTNLSLSHDFNLFSACGFPPFTNFTGGFKGTLDYIFADKKYLEVEAVIPLPSEDDLSLHFALPSVVQPSDHLALVCDLKWKQESENFHLTAGQNC